MDLTLATQYLTDMGGDPKKYMTGLARGQRIGQAFFNALSESDQHKVRGTKYDMFYGGQEEVYAAIDFLTQG